MIVAIQLRELEIPGHVDGLPVCHGTCTVHSGALIGTFEITQNDLEWDDEDNLSSGKTEHLVLFV